MVDTSRKLASIQIASEITPIKGADSIEACRVGGWVCVVKKGEFNINDKGVYFEIDSFLPSTDKRFEFLSSNFFSYNGKSGARLKTMRLRGQLSQGLFMPITLFPELQDRVVGENVTAELGVDKWEPAVPSELAGEAKVFPSFIPKTEQPRIQNLEGELERDRGQVFEVTTKLDGMSMTVYYKDETIGVCSRNLELLETDGNKLWQVANRSLVEVLRFLKKNLALQGEIIGEGVQGNPEKIKGQDFFLFDIYDIDEKRYLTPLERKELVTSLGKQGMTLKHVPIHEDMTLSHSAEELLVMADGQSLNPKQRREGLVFKRHDGLFSFKVISNKYLEKQKD